MLEENIQKQINVLIERYPQIDNCKKEIEEAYLVLEESYANGNKLLVAGNIQSRPISDKAWEYRFFVDFEGRFTDTAVQNALRGIREEAIALKILGTY